MVRTPAVRAAAAELPRVSYAVLAVSAASWSAAFYVPGARVQGFATNSSNEKKQHQGPEMSHQATAHQDSPSHRGDGGLASSWGPSGHLLMRSSQWLRRVLSTDPDRASEAPFHPVAGASGTTRGCAVSSLTSQVPPHHQHQQQQSSGNPCLASARAVAERLSRDYARRPSEDSSSPRSGVRRPVSCN